MQWKASMPPSIEAALSRPCRRLQGNGIEETVHFGDFASAARFAAGSVSTPPLTSAPWNLAASA
jgi:hypothetical protein